jgi:DNA-binding transcriptional LysR family regulator
MKALEHNVVIELRHLRYFLAVYRELHFGRAAARLHMAQPPLSQAIRKLEAALGIKLFDRTSRSVKPTQAGHALAEGAQNVFAAFDRALASARIAGASYLTLRIGCVPELPISRLLQFLASLQQRARDASPKVVHLTSAEQFRQLRTGSLDLAICHHSADYDDFDTEPLFPGEPLTILLPPSHPLAERPFVQPEELKDEPLVAFPRENDPGLFDGVLSCAEASGYRFSGVHETGGADSRDLVLAVASGSGVALVAASLPELDDTLGIVVRRPLDPVFSMPDTVVAWPVDPPRLPAGLVQSLRELARELRATAANAPREIRS